MSNVTDELDRLTRERANFDICQRNPPPRLRISAIADRCGVTEEFVIELIRKLRGDAAASGPSKTS